MKLLWRPILLAGVIFTGTFAAAEAQVVLNRVSISERADGRGLVIRNHLSAMPESFQVLHPAENRVQFVMYSDEIVIENFMEAVITGDIESITYYTGPGYFAYEITIMEGIAYLANAYPDVNQTDVLLALERATASDLAGVIEPGLELFDEEPLTEEEAATIDPEWRYPTVEDSDLLESVSVTAKYGIKGGLTSSNFYGVGYDRNPRSGVTIAASAIVDFPAYLPHDLSLGLETGVYFTQKGFTDSAASKLTVEVAEFDYIEIPVLAKLKYREQNRISPHLVLGPYVGFIANSESEDEDGERSDLDEFTRSVDFGGMAGLGVDIRVGGVIIDLQIRQSLGFTTLFDDPLFDDDEKLRQLSLVFGIRF